VRDAVEQVDRRRRAVVAAAAIGPLAFQVGGIDVLLTPAEARAKGASFNVFTAGEARTCEAFGDCLVPGARAAGIAHYVDANLARPAGQSLLMLRYLDVLPPHADFYRHGLNSLNAESRNQHGQQFADLDETAASRLVAAIAQASPTGWNGPPSPLFYFAARGDAVDIVYGTQAGFEKLSIPYLAHIAPKRDY